MMGRYTLISLARGVLYPPANSNRKHPFALMYSDSPLSILRQSPPSCVPTADDTGRLQEASIRSVVSEKLREQSIILIQPPYPPLPWTPVRWLGRGSQILITPVHRGLFARPMSHRRRSCHHQPCTTPYAWKTRVYPHVGLSELFS